MMAISISLCLPLTDDFQFLDRRWLLFLNVAVTPRVEFGAIVVVCALPCVIVRWRAESLLVERAAGEWEHRNRLADPNVMRFHPLLPLADHFAIIVLIEDEVGLHPG